MNPIDRKLISTYKSIDGAIVNPPLRQVIDFSKIFDDPSLRTKDLYEEDKTINWEVKYDAEQRLEKIYFV